MVCVSLLITILRRQRTFAHWQPNIRRDFNQQYRFVPRLTQPQTGAIKIVGRRTWSGESGSDSRHLQDRPLRFGGTSSASPILLLLWRWSRGARPSEEQYWSRAAVLCRFRANMG